MFKLTETDKRPDVLLLVSTLLLVTVGTVMIYSSSSILAMERYQDAQYFLKKQIFFVLLGLTAMVFLTKVPYQKLRYAAYPGLAAAAVLLGLILIPHVGVKAGGATRWLNLGIITFQVTELVKVSLVVFLAHFLTRKIAQIKRFSRGIAIPLAVTLFIVGLVMLQPDFGSAAILMAILLLMLYLAGTRLVYLGGMAAAFLPVALYLVIHKSYRMARLMTFLDPWKDPRNSGFQIIQSLLSFGSGGTFGVGLGDGMQKLFYLPEPHTDFILSVIAEESGFIGVAIVILLFGVLIIRGFFIAFKAPDLFGTLLAAGLTMTLALEAFINIAGVMGLIPLKGLALPFLSYGGSALLMSLAAVGILLNISAQES
ncbi:MAG: putative lipid II flippase FtsW [Syntrophales bacterium]|jgi:cell division protein FtsW|nr:putative lipid II flippase FtsW [Syntrophales bacterium]HOG07448.1 putative lipid II flippase FtsW [Syntrophales bacterium]HOS77511.1 putative lipid II flippase FtsW [Syntrophales bacterium]HPB69999.1 putative lipid II flippase FtsW [Syntrophales bacterium]HQN25830.1 putative lipid II flippase FtsW [Syntrophales bacterium]